METLEEDLEKKSDKDALKELAEELDAISLGLKGKVYRAGTVQKLENILGKVYVKTRITSKNALIALRDRFYPSSSKVLTSIILGPASSYLFIEVANQNQFHPSMSDLTNIGAIISSLSYCLQSFYNNPRNR